MTDAAVASAMAKYPADQGWTQIWLPDNQGKLFAKGTPREISDLSRAFSSKDIGPSPVASVPTVSDYINQTRGWQYGSYDRSYGGGYGSVCTSGRCQSVGAPVPYATAATEEPIGDRFSISPDALVEQIAKIKETLSAASDGGRLERALAISQMALPALWAEGSARLASVYLGNPNLVADSLDADFHDVNDEALRRLLGRAVTEANRAKDAKSWITVAAIMAAQDRPDVAQDILERAKKATTDGALLDQIDALARELRRAETAAAR